jgi:hypothetical protein
MYFDGKIDFVLFAVSLEMLPGLLPDHLDISFCESSSTREHFSCFDSVAASR